MAQAVQACNEAAHVDLFQALVKEETRKVQGSLDGKCTELWVRENKVKDDFSKILVNVVSKAPEPSEETVTPNAYVVTLPSMRAAETFVGDVDHLSSILASIQTRQDVGCLWEDDARRIRKVLARQKSKAEGHIHQMLGEERQSRKETPNQPTMSYEEDLWNTAKGHWAQAENWAAAAERDSRTV